jgi:hypothetical protein
MATCVICNHKIGSDGSLRSIDPWASFYQGMEVMNSHYIKCFTTHQKAVTTEVKARETRAVTAEAEAKIYRELMKNIKLVPKNE